MPSGSHNAAIAIEDGVALAGLFSRIHDRSHVQQLLGAFEDIRQPRCADTMASERQSRNFISLPHGPHQQERDGGLRASMAMPEIDWDDINVDDPFVQATWEAYIDQFAYDPSEVGYIFSPFSDAIYRWACSTSTTGSAAGAIP